MDILNTNTGALNVDFHYTRVSNCLKNWSWLICKEQQWPPIIVRKIQVSKKDYH